VKSFLSSSIFIGFILCICTQSEAADYPINPVSKSHDNLVKTSCFPIHTIQWSEDVRARFDFNFLWDIYDDRNLGIRDSESCLDAAGLEKILEQAQNALIQKGFITSRAYAPPQNLNQGTLELKVLPGRVEKIKTTQNQTRVQWRNALPMKDGDLLQIRDLEQGLENLQRIPTVEAQVQIEPSSQPGFSDVVVNWTQSKVWRMTFNADDSGSKSSGKYQGVATFSLDHPLLLNDLFYASLSRDLGGGESGYRGTRGVNVHYSVPWDYWLLALNFGKNRYFQTIAGFTQDYLYSGNSAQQDIQISHHMWRNEKSKLSWRTKAFARQSENFIDDTEVVVQRRRVGGYELGLQYKTQWAQWQVNASVAYKRGTKMFGATIAPEALFDEGTHRFRLWMADLQWQTPLNQEGWVYQGIWHWQAHQTRLTPQDRLSIGGRYSVRGFDGERTLSGERGWWVRQELSKALHQTSHSLYFGLDHGQVGGPSAAYLPGRHLTGFAMGMRGQLARAQWEGFVGGPLDKPAQFVSPQSVVGLQLSLLF
jgi:hemolysin activation/secretion protein